MSWKGAWAWLQMMGQKRQRLPALGVTLDQLEHRGETHSGEQSAGFS